MDPLSLIKYDLTFTDVMVVIEANNRQVGGQYINLGSEQYLVRGLGLVRNERDIRDMVVKVEGGAPVYLRNIAEIRQGGALRFGAVTRDGKEVVLGMVLSRIGENAARVVEATEEKVAIIDQSLPDGVVLRPVYERTDLVEKAVGTATNALFQGAILVGVILFLFLGEWRPAVVVIVSIPLTMLITFVFMDEAGLSANLMSLAGLAIGIGMIVDGAVVVVENSFRVMAERRAETEEVNRTAAVLAAAREVVNPVTFAILIIMVVFLPLFALEELISGVRATLAAKIYGEDLTVLDRLSEEVKDVIAEVEGVADLSLEANVGKPQIRIQVKRDQLARFGVNADDVLSVVRTGIGNEPVSTLIDGVRRFDITARFDDRSKASVQSIQRIPLKTSDGAIVPLATVADVSVAEGYSFVRREQLQRYAVIQMDVRGRDVDGFVRDANAAIDAQIDLPPGYWIEWGGAFENQQRALARLSVIVPLTIFFIFVLLYTAFNSVKYAALIIANVPFATIGGMVVLFISGQYVSVPSAIGFIAVFGVAMLNGIVLVSFINGLREKGLGVAEAVRRGAELRLRPVLMTASTSILGLVPLLLATGVGAETQRPLASVVVGGLITSTLLTLVLLPVIYEWIETRRQ